MKVVENKKIYKANDKILSEQPDGGAKELAPDALCSMNMMGFTPKIIPFYEQYFRDFLKEHLHDLKAEFYMPEVISRRMQDEGGSVVVLPTTSKRFGVTYQADKEATKENIKKLIAAGEYPENLWE
ncbi:MAG: hypothetical protein LBU27_05255 [Candidatus Peribacteria bacterium]|jgi:hypothetical protein|nr:hypothetical protein [Candidatus Peribacteria bacterium]